MSGELSDFEYTPEDFSDDDFVSGYVDIRQPKRSGHLVGHPGYRFGRTEVPREGERYYSRGRFVESPACSFL